MKHIPKVVALSIAAFLILCFLQARGRGFGFVPPPTEWELHPAWWHFNLLANIGNWLVVYPATFMLIVFAHGFGVFFAAIFDNVVSAWLIFGLPIAIETATAYYALHKIREFGRKGA